jgi:hypothetical protein
MIIHITLILTMSNVDCDIENILTQEDNVINNFIS